MYKYSHQVKMHCCWNCIVLLATLLLVRLVPADEAEVCKEIKVINSLRQHSSTFIKDASGNPANIKRVSLLEQSSVSPCVKWETFAHFGSSVVVKDGCQGRFNVCFTSGIRPPSVPVTEVTDCITVRLMSRIRDPAEKIIVRSDGHGDLIVSMTLLQSFSAVSCVPGLSYNYYGHKVESKFGCKGDFRVCLDRLIILESEISDFSQKRGHQS